MNLCSDGHDEVCYEIRNCPACDVGVDKDREISDLENQMADLRAEVEELTAAVKEG